MSLATELDYSLGTTSPFSRAVLKVSATRAGSWILRRVLYRLDALVLRLSEGRSTFTATISGLRPLWLTTTGANTGKARTVPVFGFPIGESIALLGTSYGQAKTPGWVYNLEANPNSQVSFNNRSIPVLARKATPVEVPVIWDSAVSHYAGFAAYRERAAHREIRVFVLESA